MNLLNKKPYYNLQIQGTGIAIQNIINISDICSQNIKDVIKSCKEYTGTLNLNMNISHRGINGYAFFKNFGFRHIKTDIPFSFKDLPIKFTESKIILEKLIFNVGKTGQFPVLTDVTISNYMKIPIVRGFISCKPTEFFVERYINTKLQQPVKINGDIELNAKINGSIDSINISPTLKLNKNSDISYLTVNFGDTNFVREIQANIFIQPNNIILKNLEYIQHKVLSDGKVNSVSMWRISANLKKIKDKIYKPIYISLKTYKDRPAKILNFIFKKSIIKSGTFDCDILYKSNGEQNFKLEGFFNIINAEIPTYNTKVKKGILLANNDKIEIVSNGTFVDTDFNFNTQIYNSAVFPIKVRNVLLEIQKMDLERLIEYLNRLSIEAYSNNSVKTDIKFDISDIIINKGVLKADNIKYKNCQITNLEANFSLDNKAELKINAENFKIADGIAENKITYNFKDGNTNCLFKAKGINSNSAAASFLGLQNQITGKADVKVSIQTSGLDETEKIKNSKGIIYFSVKDGNMPKLGSLEYLIRASNIFYSGFTTLSVNNLIELMKPFKHGTFSTITGIFNINRGKIDNLRLYSQGINMSLYMNGCYNIEESEADIVVYGKLGKKIENLFGPIGNLSANTIFNMISKDVEEGLYAKEIKKIPDIEYKNQDVKYFRATVQGNINESDSATTFKWIK